MPVTVLPATEVFQLRENLKSSDGTWGIGGSIPQVSYPILGILSGGGITEGISQVYTVLVWRDNAWNSRFITYDSVSGIVGVQVPLSGSERIVRWKWLDNPLSGTGLKGEYFDNMSLTGSPIAVQYENIDMYWDYQEPVFESILSAIDFSVRWSGFIKIPETGNYNFRIISNDGVRLWIDNILYVDDWVNQNTLSSNTGAIPLLEGYVPITVEYFQGQDIAEIHLMWSTPAMEGLYTIIPPVNLYMPSYIV